MRKLLFRYPIGLGAQRRNTACRCIIKARYGSPARKLRTLFPQIPKLPRNLADTELFRCIDNSFNEDDFVWPQTVILPSTPMTERRAAVRCITRAQKEKKEATMMDLIYTVETKSAILQIYNWKGDTVSVMEPVP